MASMNVPIAEQEVIEIFSDSDEQMGTDKITEMVDLTMADDERPISVAFQENAAGTPELLSTTNISTNTFGTPSAPQVPEKPTPQRLDKEEPQQLDEDMLDSSIKDEEANKAQKSPHRTKNINDEVQKTESMAKLKNTVSMIRNQVEDRHESRVVDAVKDSLAKCLQQDVDYSHATSFFNPPGSYYSGRGEETSERTLYHGYTLDRDEAGGPRRKNWYDATAVTLNSSEPHKIPEYINYITINRSFHVQESELAPNPRPPHPRKQKHVEDQTTNRILELTEIGKTKELEKSRSFIPYRDHITKAMKSAKVKSPGDEGRVRATVKSILDIDEDGLRHLLSKQQREQNRSALAEEPAASHITGCIACATDHCFTHGHYEAPSFSDPTTNKLNAADGKYQKHRTDRLRGFIGLRKPVDEENITPAPASESNNSTPEDLSCANQCYKEEPRSSDKITTKEWTAADREAVQTAYDLSLRNSCVMADLVGRPCTEVYKYMMFMRPGPYATAAEDKLVKRSAKFDEYKAHLHDTAPQPMPCYHPGLSCPKAGQKCSCTRAKMYCNDGCPCPSDCNRRYPGCECVGGCARAGLPDPVTALRKCLHKRGDDKNCVGCKLKSLEVVNYNAACRCQKLNRECTPGICKCDVKECLSPKGSSSKTKCQNCGIQEEKGRDMALITSSLAGYGVVLNEPVKYGDYLGEYVGEIITKERDEERHALLDRRRDCNYLFTLNADLTIDSGYYGNVTRFINNSLEGRNCHAAVRLVNGEHRIGFWSTASLSAGTELFFYYGKDFDYLFWQGQESDESDNEELENENSEKGQFESGSGGGDALKDDEGEEPPMTAKRKKTRTMLNRIGSVRIEARLVSKISGSKADFYDRHCLR